MFLGSNYVIFAILSGIVDIIGFSIYIWGMLEDDKSNDFVAWLVWATLGLLAFFESWSGVWKPVLIILFIGAIMQIFIASLSLWYGSKITFGKDDIFILIGCILSLIIWYFTRNPIHALIVVISFDAYGSIRNIKKSWHFPNSEELISWILFTIAGFIGLFSIEHFTFLESSYLMYLTAASFITTLVILLRKKRLKRV